MQISSIFLGLALLISAGCDSDSSTLVVDTNSTEEPINSQETLVAMFAGATFVSVDELETGVDAVGGMKLGNWLVSFTADTVTWAHSDIVEVGTYAYTADSDLVAQFSDREVSFKADGSNLTWDSLRYRRAAASQFDSQQSLVTFFDGSKYNTVELFDVGETVTGELAMGNWSLWFRGDEISWAVQDTVRVGTYTYVNGSTFNATFLNVEFTVVVLDNNQLIVDSIIYEKDFSNQFNSQATLEAFLNDASYKSVGLRDIGETSSGVTALGNWYVDFLGNTFTWAYQDVAEVGIVAYVDGETFTAIFSDRELKIEVEGDDIIWDGVRYAKVIGE